MEAMAESLARNIDPAMAGFVGAVFSLHDPIEVEGLLRDAGFTDVAAQVTTLAVRLPEPRDFLWQYVHGTPLGAAVTAADDARRETVEREVVARWLELMEDGHLVLRQPNVFATGRT